MQYRKNKNVLELIKNVIYSVHEHSNVSQYRNHISRLSFMFIYKGKGDSFDDPIIIENVSDEFFGIKAMYRYIEQNFGVQGKDWKLVSQSLIRHKNRWYDILVIQLSNGEEKKLHFDITNYYEKW